MQEVSLSGARHAAASAQAGVLRGAGPSPRSGPRLTSFKSRRPFKKHLGAKMVGKVLRHRCRPCRISTVFVDSYPGQKSGPCSPEAHPPSTIPPPRGGMLWGSHSGPMQRGSERSESNAEGTLQTWTRDQSLGALLPSLVPLQRGLHLLHPPNLLSGSSNAPSQSWQQVWPEPETCRWVS